MEELDEAFLGSFLDHLEHQRRNSVRTRNTRLAALHAFFRYVALHADLPIGTAKSRLHYALVAMRMTVTAEPEHGPASLVGGQIA